MLNLATRPLSTDCPEEARATVSIAHSAHTACLTRFQPAKSRMLSKTSTWHALFQFARLASTESFNAFRTKNSSSTRLAASRLRSATTSRSATRTRASAARRRLTTTKNTASLATTSCNLSTGRGFIATTSNASPRKSASAIITSSIFQLLLSRLFQED